MRPFKDLISFTEALRISLDLCKPVEETETVSLENASGRVLSEDVISGIDVPAFTRAAMDGYAVRSDDTAQASDDLKISLRVTSKVFAGEGAKSSVETGECAQIATGAPLPEGADAVIPVEQISEGAGYISLRASVEKGYSLGEKGEDIKSGETVLSVGRMLNPAAIGAAAAVGLSEIQVYRKPVVAISTTGDEIVAPGVELEPGQIYDTNSYTLGVAVENAGSRVERLPSARDTVERLEEIIRTAEADLVVFTGGTSVGDRDFVVDAVVNLGEVKYHGVRIKPGKPMLLGDVGGKLVLGMPGYPTSSLTVTYLLMLPMLRKMARMSPEGLSTKREAELAEDVLSPFNTHQLVTVGLKDGVATPVFRGSSVITSMSRADGYIEIPEGIDKISRGEKVEVILI